MKGLEGLEWLEGLEGFRLTDLIWSWCWSWCWFWCYCISNLFGFLWQQKQHGTWSHKRTTVQHDWTISRHDVTGPYNTVYRSTIQHSTAKYCTGHVVWSLYVDQAGDYTKKGWSPCFAPWDLQVSERMTQEVTFGTCRHHLLYLITWSTSTNRLAWGWYDSTRFR